MILEVFYERTTMLALSTLNIILIAVGAVALIAVVILKRRQ
jgi:hypothetical protein